jgi:aminoglycoside phosphotransferase (APT) family kinase protein
MISHNVWKLLLKPSPETALPAGDGIINLLETAPADADLENRVRAAARGRGQVCLVFHNKHSFQRLRRRGTRGARTWIAPGRAEQVLHDAGFARCERYALYPRGRSVFEIIDAGETGRDAGSTFREAVRAILQKSAVMRGLHPAYAVVASRDDAPAETWIPGLAREAGLHGLRRCLMGHPDTLLLVGDDAIVRVPLNALSRVRCRQNARMLRRLQRTGIAGLVPALLRAGRHRDQEFYCESRIRGIAVDDPVPGMDGLVRQAAVFITEFHRATARDIVLDDRNFRRLVDRDCRRLAACLDADGRAALTAVRSVLAAAVAGRPFMTVWSHGDFKVENVLFGADRKSIAGVIDWDLARAAGMPLLDVLYLLLYKDSLMTGAGVFEIFRSRFLRGRYSASEREIIDAYLRRLGLTQTWVRPLQIMFVINHYACRLRQQLDDPRTLPRLRREIKKSFAAILESSEEKR